MSSPTASVLGEIGLPEPLRALAAKTWDVVIVGAGHNGLACAAYLARAGQRVLVIESRDAGGRRLHHRRTFSWGTHVAVRVSCRPAASPGGEELDLARRGFRWTPAVNGLFVPFLDGCSIQLWDEDARCDDEVRKLAPGDVDGFNAMGDVVRRLRDALRPGPAVRGMHAGRHGMRGSAMRRRGTKLKSGWATIRKRARCCLTGRWRSLWSAIYATSVCRWLISARA